MEIPSSNLSQDRPPVAESESAFYVDHDGRPAINWTVVYHRHLRMARSPVTPDIRRAWHLSQAKIIASKHKVLPNRPTERKMTRIVAHGPDGRPLNSGQSL